MASLSVYDFVQPNEKVPDKRLCSRPCQHPKSLLRAAGHNTALTQCRAGIKLPGNRSICQIQQVANQNQPTRSMVVPEQKEWVLSSVVCWQEQTAASVSGCKLSKLILLLWSSEQDFFHIDPLRSSYLFIFSPSCWSWQMFQSKIPKWC